MSKQSRKNFSTLEEGELVKLIVLKMVGKV